MVYSEIIRTFVTPNDKVIHEIMIQKKTFLVDADLRTAWPQYVGGVVYATFTNTPYSEGLWTEIRQQVEEMRSRYTVDSIKQISGIEATRRAYKACGKDPSRYRPSNEQLVRRTLQGKDLYQIDTAVDLVNLASIRFGYSIGGFDYDRIEGDTIALGIGREGEPYEGIGRGPLNIAGLPVIRDSKGGIGTPTSDHERTKMSLQTTHLLALVNGYDGNTDQVRACCQFICDLMERYAEGHDFSIEIY